MPKVYYWEGAISAHAEEFQDCKKQISALLEGNYLSADLDTKKLPGYKLHTARLNKSDRLLFTTIKVAGKSQLLLLEVIYNHDYQKSKYLNDPSKLKKFFEKDHADLPANLEAISEDFFQEAKESPLDNQVTTNNNSDEELSYQPAFYYQERFLVLNETQASVAKANLPLIVSGPPGSGKSCLALSLLKQHYLRPNTEGRPIAYVTKSPFLTRHMQKLWQDLPEALEEKAESAIEFKTYEELFSGLQQEKVAYAHFEAWFQKLNKKAKAKLEEFPTDLIYQELQIFSTVGTAEDYLKIGRKNTLLGVGKEEAMRELYQHYQAYLRHLTETNVINLDFYEPEDPFLCQAMVVDEAQDFTPAQLRTLLRMSTNSQIAYCLDTHQSLIACKSTLPYLESLIRKNHIKLPLAYRSGKNIISFANRLIALKNNCVGGAAVKDELREIQLPEDHSQAPGVLNWFNPDAKLSQEFPQLKTHYKENEIAVVAWPPYLEEARQAFNTPLLFTPEQIKGLEYKVVLAYRPLDTELFSKANIKLRLMDLKDIKSRPKGEAEDRFGPPFNQLFTLSTRAIDHLVFLQEKAHRVKELVKDLEPFFNKHLGVLPSAPVQAVQETSVSEWQNQAEILLASGNVTQAREIFISKLKKSDLEFISFKERFLGLEQESKMEQQSESKSDTQQKPLKDNSDSKTKPKSQKTQKYIEGLARNPSYKNLSNLFDFKVSFYNEVLFTAPFPKEVANCRTMFEYLALEHEAIFAEVLKDKKKVMSHFDPKLLEIALGQTEDPTSSQNLVYTMAVNHSKVIQLMIKHCPSVAKQVQDYVSKIESGDESVVIELAKVLVMNFKAGNAESLNEVLFERSVKYKDHQLTIIEVLLQQPSSLSGILQDNEAYLSLIAVDKLAKALCSVCPLTETTYLSLIMSSGPGVDSLWFLLSRVTGLAASISTKAWVNPAYDSRECPFAFLLARGAKGVDVCHGLLGYKPSLIGELSIKDLVRPIGVLGELNLLLAISSYDFESVVIWQMLLKENRKVIEELTAHELCQSFYVLEVQYPISIFLALSRVAKGSDVLESILEINPLLVLGFNNKNGQFARAYKYFMANEKGAELMKSILEKNPALKAEIRPESPVQSQGLFSSSLPILPTLSPPSSPTP